MPEIFNKDKMTSGLDKLREGINLVRDAADEMRMAARESNGDTYYFIDLGCTVLVQATQIPWQIYERFRQRFR